MIKGIDNEDADLLIKTMWLLVPFCLKMFYFYNLIFFILICLH